MPYQNTEQTIPELYLLIREYEATIQVTCDPSEQWRLRQILRELRACVTSLETPGSSTNC